MKNKILVPLVALALGAGLLLGQVLIAWAFDPLGGLSSGGSSSPPSGISTSGTPVYYNEDVPVTDMDALTEGAGNTKPPAPEPAPASEPASTTEPAPAAEPATAPAPTSTQETDNFDQFELTLAECIIMEKLEISDARCDKLRQALACPVYTECLTNCPPEKFESCAAFCEATEPECAARYPAEWARLPAGKAMINYRGGDVRIAASRDVAPDKMTPVNADTEIGPGTVIYTGDQGGLKLRFSESTEAYLGDGAYFEVVEFFQSDNIEETITSLGNGQVRIKLDTERGGRKAAFIVITPLGKKIRAKGTEFIVTAYGDENFTVETLEGEVEILNKDDQVIATVPAGEEYENYPGLAAMAKEDLAREAKRKDAEGAAAVPDEFDFSAWARDNMESLLSVAGVAVVLGAVIFLIARSRRKRG